MAGRLLSVTFDARSVKFREQSLTVVNIAMIFKLDPASIYLTSEPEGEIVLADETGRFHVNGTDYRVHGDAKQAQELNRSPQPTFGQTSSSNLVIGSSSRTRFNPPPAAGQLKRPRFTNPSFAARSASSNWRKAFILIEADKEGNVTEKCQLHLVLTEETASVDKIKTMLKDQLGYSVSILDSKHLPILSSDLTKGAQFWKSARKVLAVKDDQISYLSKGKKTRGRKPADGLMEELRKFFSGAKDEERPSTPHVQSVQETLEEILRCTICLSTAKLPAACCSQCFTVIGCIPCTEQWIESSLSLEKCPLCRTSAAYDTIPLVRGIASILGQEVPSGAKVSASSAVPTNTLETFNYQNDSDDDDNVDDADLLRPAY